MQSFDGEWFPNFLMLSGDRGPFLHQAPVAPCIKARSGAGGDELVDAVVWEFHDELARHSIAKIFLFALRP